MAKKEENKYPFPSRFGSHKEMLIKDNEDGTVVCKDEYGEYTTFKNRLDSGMSDPKRWEDRVKIEKEGKKT